MLDKLTNCINEVRIWMAKNYLKLNDDKTDFILIGNKLLLSKATTEFLAVGDHRVPVSMLRTSELPLTRLFPWKLK